MKRLLYSLLATCLVSGTGFAQGSWCSTDYHHQELVKKDPTLEADISRLVANGFTKNDDTTVYIIPIVFHIVHQHGIENISDAQVRNQVDILNRDYRLRNSDTSNVIQEFKRIYGDVRIEFRLAQIDPYGNCTNGINRIVSHETNIGDAYIKLSQWDRAKYMNVWVCGDMEGGTAGYAHYPTDVNGSNFWIDGIVIRHNYIGSTGTGSAHNSRALTHEIGHWLGLPHVWGSNNNPGVACGDDGFPDTPITKGWTTCPLPANSAICDPAIKENYQNYMDYSYCSVMFTKKQIEAMRNYAIGTDGQRNKLITAENHELTGIFLTTNICLPKPAISVNNLFPCIGTSVTFKDESYNAPIVSREWTFQDATPATSTDANPQVVFNSFGSKTVTLKVTSAAGTVTETYTNYISVLQDFSIHKGPYEYSLNTVENFQQLRFLDVNNTGNKYSYSTNKGKNGSGAIQLINHRITPPGSLPFSPEATYYRTLGGQVDAIIVPASDLRTTTNASFSFDFAYATDAANVTDITEKITVYVSRNCGNTWQTLPGTAASNTLTGAAIVSGGFAGNEFYSPRESDWKTFTKTFSTSSADSRTMFKIEFTASDFSNNLYIDNIRLTGQLGIQDLSISEMELNVYPNPVSAGKAVTIEYVAANEPVTFTLLNLQGEVISSVVRDEVNQFVSFELETKNQIAAAYYFLEVKTATGRTVKKIAVMK